MEKTIILNGEHMVAICNEAFFTEYQGENLIKVILDEDNFYYIGTQDRFDYTIDTIEVPNDYFEREDDNGMYSYSYLNGEFIKEYLNECSNCNTMNPASETQCINCNTEL
jgi:hypothetical protein